MAVRKAVHRNDVYLLVQLAMSGTARGLLVAALASSAALAGCGGAASALSTPSTAPLLTASPSPTPDPAVAASEYQRAVAQLSQADNADILKQNSDSAATAIVGLNARVQDHQAFDQAVQLIPFPAAYTADANAVITTDRALESGYALLASNRNDVNGYNQLFPTVVPLHSAWISALDVLARDLGLPS